MAPKDRGKQNLTISLDRKTIQKARIVAARESTSISALVARQIEVLVGEEEAYERAMRQALAMLEKGFHMGDVKGVSRDELHDRHDLR
jgi:SOS response regulatory protein OraA/RecX